MQCQKHLLKVNVEQIIFFYKMNSYYLILRDCMVFVASFTVDKDFKYFY